MMFPAKTKASSGPDRFLLVPIGRHIHSAAAAGRESEIGTIAPGKQADLVVLNADPLVDIHNIRHVAFVVLRGRIVQVR